ncbi:MAG: glycoside hydrolase family 3 protein [Candidatus Eremiobacteraeota bacterium]|nr:glycoside hydrolase family 3 protein [Candidatus Eremiobacteraeota bacterium]
MSDRTCELAFGVIASGFENGALTELPPFGGYLLFARNGISAATVREVTDALRSQFAGVPPPLIGIDQEGGRVARLRERVEPMPPMLALGAAGDVELAARAGEQTAFDLRRAGCSLDFAPVLDLALDPRNTVIGNRSLGSDPEAVAQLGERFARALMGGGVTPCYKHFPGHGATDVDSHVARPFVDVAEATLRRRDLLPFARVAGTAPAIMGAHVVARALDAENPASLSARAVALLRDDLGFFGAYVTDCLEMGAVEGGDPEIAVRALLAGADLLLFSHRPDFARAAAGAIEAAVAGGRLPLARLREAHARVLRLRTAASDALPLDLWPPHPGVGREIARRAITLIRGFPHADPTASHALQFGEPAVSLAREAPALTETVLALEPDGAAVENALESMAHGGRRPIVLARRAHLYPPQAAAVARVVERFPDAVVVSVLEPFDVVCFPSARHLLAAYGDDSACTGGLADVLFSGIMPQGRLPLFVGDEFARA